MTNNRLALIALLTAITVLPALAAPQTASLSVGEQAFIERIAQDCTVVPLWPGGLGPDETQPDLEEAFELTEDKTIKIRNVIEPTMVIIPPPNGIAPTGPAVLCCPGGAYNSLSTYNIEMISQWLGSMGVTTVMLKYRVPRRPDDRTLNRLPLQDAQRAMGLLRSRARQWNIDPDKIAVAGFSAGGHLAFNLATNFDKRAYNPIDRYDKTSCRPNAAILLYPAYLTKPIESLDPNPNLEMDNLSAEKTPPIFMAITRPDKFAFGCVSATYALRKAKVPTELHIYPDGGHSGLFNKYPLMEFARPCARFLKDQGLFGEEMQKNGEKWLDKQVPITKKNLFPDSKPKPRPKTTKTKTARLTAVAKDKLTLGENLILKAANTDHPVLRLWPGDGTAAGDPLTTDKEQQGSEKNNVLRLTNVTRPSMTIFQPKRSDGRAVIIFPGGAYNMLAAQHEGTEIAQWLNESAITAFIVKYRVPRRDGLESHAVALQDAQRAIRLVRSNAKNFGIDPDQIGVLGFSAGGNLAALTCHQHPNPSYTSVDVHDNTSPRPNFAVLIYPAYTTTEKTGSEINPLLKGQSRDDLQPVFIAIAADDSFTPSALHYFLSLREAKLPVECHVYQKGGHGKGLRAEGYPFSEWTKACERWLTDLQTIAPLN